jgi:hypothetical protein
MPPLAHSNDGTVYLVLHDFGELGPETVIADLLSGQYRHPLRCWPSTPRELGARRQRRHRAPASP